VLPEREVKVLVVDDNDDQLELRAAVFRQAGYSVLTACDGLAGIEAARRERPDLIVSDVTMPRADGIELCRAVRAEPALSHTPILLVSALRKDTASAVEGLRAGADEYLEAPFVPIRLAALAARLIERKCGEDAVRESEERYRAFIAHSSEGIWRLELEEPIPVTLPEDEQIELLYAHCRLAECNDRMARMYGFDRAEELVGARLSRFLPRSRPGTMDYLRSFVRAGYQMTDAEYAEFDPAGSERLLLNNVVGIVEGGLLRRVWGTHRDVTERKRAAEALRESHSLLEAIIEGAADIIFVKDKEGRYLMINTEGARAIGRPVGEIVGLTDAGIFPPALSARLAEDDRQVLLTGKTQTFEDVLELANGTRICLTTKSPYRNHRGEVIGLCGIARDITEMKRAEAALRESEDRFQAFMDNSPAMAFMKDKEGRYVFVSGQAGRFFGIEPGRWLGKTAFDLWPEEFARRLDEKNRAVLSSGRTTEFVDVFPGPDGSPRSMLSFKFPLRDSAGRALLGGVVIDITERVRGEEMLHESNETLRALIHGSPLAIIGLDTEWRVTAWNPAAERTFGWAEAEVLGRPLEEVDGAGPEESHALADRAYESGDLTGVEARRRRKDGSPVDLSISFSVLRDRQGTARGVVKIAEDITVRKAMDAALLEANQRAILEYERLLERIAALAQSLGVARDLSSVFRAVLDFTLLSAPCSALSISLYDADTRTRRVDYLWYNGREQDVSGLEAIAVGDGAVGRAVATGEVQLAEDDYFKRLGGKQTTVYKGYEEDPRNPRSALVAPMAYKGAVVGVVEIQCYEEAAYTSGHVTAMSMAANLTANAVENVRLYEREREKEEQLRHSQRLESVGKLAGGVAHDFNNLLVAINGYSDLSLRRLEEGDPVRYNVEEIKRAGERAAALTSQLLAFSRKQVMQPKLISLNEVVTDMNRMLRRVIGEDIELVVALAPDLGVIRADPNMLEQVVLNLCVNSRDAMPRGGRLVIETSNVALDDAYAYRHVGVKPGRYVCLSVSDTGEGMDAKTRARVFEPFFTTKEMGKGTGLGLSTVYGIVKQSGGNVWVYSEAGQGSVFKVYLPRVEEGPVEERAAPEAAPPPAGSEKILLVEDDSLVRLVVREIISEQGYEVLAADGPAEAERLFREHEDIELLLTDVVMPQMNGKELAERLLGRRPALRVLFMSGYSEAVVRDGALEEGIEFIQKPFTPDALLRKLREVLDSDPRKAARPDAPEKERGARE
jgi:PAS domain S-box-containing protein